MKPKRIQRKRTKGWRMPEGAIYVGRPTMWQNPFKLSVWGREGAMAMYMNYLKVNPGISMAAKQALCGKDLSCWCRLDQPCHADVLLEIANSDYP